MNLLQKHLILNLKNEKPIRFILNERERRHEIGTTAHVVAFLANGRHAVCSKNTLLLLLLLLKHSNWVMMMVMMCECSKSSQIV